MSAIFGLLETARGARPGGIGEMSRALAACGPHADGSWSRGPIALGARILHDTPEARCERQPLVDRAGRYVLVADARLDNRRRLLAELRPAGGGEREVPDSALVLAAWERWGELAPARLEGDFAFAVWDCKERRLSCVRDPLGIKPLYYAFGPGGGLAFASQLAGLLATDLPRRLDRRRAAEYLLSLPADRRRTFFRDLRRLPPGHRLTVEVEGTPRVERYWEPAPRAGVGRLAEEEWVEALREELERSVAVRLRAEGGLASHLSGGLDSSSVACLAAQAAGGGADLRGVAFSAPAGEEHIEAASAFAGIPVRYFPRRQEGFAELLAAAAPGMLPPPLVPRAFYAWAGRRDLRVVLTGWGGDAAASFNGRGIFAALARRGHWRELAAVVAGLRARGKAPRRGRVLARRVLLPLLPDALYYRFGRRLAADAMWESLRLSCVSPRVAESVGLGSPLGHLHRERPGTGANQLQQLEADALVQRIERWSADGSRFGIEYRYPLLDRRLVELCLALPDRAFLADGRGRYAMRRAMAGALPDEIRLRSDKIDRWIGEAQRESRVRGTDVSGELRRRAERMIAEGDDLGGCLSLDAMRLRLAEIPTLAPRGLREVAPALSLVHAVSLAHFVEHNRIDTTG